MIKKCPGCNNNFIEQYEGEVYCPYCEAKKPPEFYWKIWKEYEPTRKKKIK